jgi:polyhydroxybutyrate depolymerase
MKQLIFVIALIISAHCLFGQNKTIAISGVTRSYLIHVPDNLPNGEKVPLTIALHPLGSNSSSFESLTGLSIKADQKGFIVVYPQGIGGSWNAGGCCNPAVTSNIDDVGFISTLIDTLALDYSIDTNKVFVTGWSNGGIMCYRLASEISSKLAGIAPVGALFMMNQNLADNPVPIIHFHALDDPSVLFNGMNSYKSVPQLLEDWKSINGITAAADTFRKEDGITGILYPSNDSTANIILYISQTGGHAWTINARLGTTNKIWEFFETQINKVDKVYDTVTEGTRRRDYKIHIPNRYFSNVSSNVRYPLVIAAHGWYQNPDIMEQITGFSAKADKNNFFVAYLHYMGPPPNNSWNYFKDGSRPDDIGYAKTVIDSMFAKYPVDSAKVFAIGFSDGCGMVNRLSIETKGLIKATGTVGGMVPFEDTILTTPVRMIHFHAKNDPAIPWSVIRNGSLNYWLNVNECAGNPDTLMNTQGYFEERWKNSNDSTSVMFFTLPWDQHAWPVKGISNIKLSATDLIWEFFTTGIAVAQIPSDPTTSMNNLNTDDESMLFRPNPAHNVIYVSINMKRTEKLHLDVINSLGQTILSQNIANQDLQTGEFSIDIRKLSKGYYFFKVQDENYLTTRKVFIY